MGEAKQKLSAAAKLIEKYPFRELASERRQHASTSRLKVFSTIRADRTGRLNGGARIH